MAHFPVIIYIIVLGVHNWLPALAPTSRVSHPSSTSPVNPPTLPVQLPLHPLKMNSRKRIHPEDESSLSSTKNIPPPLNLPRVLASREMFFSIPLRAVAVRDLTVEALPGPQAVHGRANTRLADPATILNSLQRASLTAVLAVLNDYFPCETTRQLTDSVANITQTNDTTLASLADKIDLGLIAFLAKRGAAQSNTPDAMSPPVPDSRITGSSATVVPPKRARVSKKSGRSHRSDKIRAACGARDDKKCRICKGGVGISAHILPFSLQGRKTVDFWSFVAIFKGIEATAELKAAAFDPDPNDADNIMNVIFLCFNCHAFLDKQLISLIPQILESPASVFPYDPRIVDCYDAVVEFPQGLQDIIVSILQADGEVKRMRPGHVLTLQTADPENLPLPHPLLLQLHVICSRMVVMRAAAGYPVLTDDGSDGDTVFDALQVAEEDVGEGKECYTEFGGKDVSRDPAVVLLELDQRKYEQQQLLQKLRGREDEVHRVLL